MSNYSTFANHLANSVNEKQIFTFKEIEEIIGECLPNSAYQYDEWWSNSKSHPLMKQILKIGWFKDALDLGLQQVTFKKESRGNAETGKLSSALHDTIFSSWSKFELLARQAIEKELDADLDGGGIDINGKIKNFDLMNKSKKIVGDIKNYAVTKAGNVPVAKFSTLNEYVWQMQLLEKYSGEHWRKILVIGEDLDMIKMYIKTFDKWLEDVEIYYFRSAPFILKRIR